MINMMHNDGDACVQLVEVETGIFEVTLQASGELVRKETTASYPRAVFEYLRFIANECACWADTNDKPTVEQLVVAPKPGTW